MSYWSACVPAEAGASTIVADAVAAPAGAVAEIKAYLRIDDAAQDALLARLAAVAIGHGESFTGRVLIARTIREIVPVRGEWRRLGRMPVAAIAAVEALPLSGPAVALGGEAVAIDIDAAGDGWVRVLDAGGARRVRVSFTAGLAADWSGLPEPIAQGVVRLAAHLFTHRDARDDGAPPAAIAALWRPWRRMRLA